MEWVTKTCEDCKYQVEGFCRYIYLPMLVKTRTHMGSKAYSINYAKACSKWRSR